MFSNQSLSGIIVLDLTRLLPGPMASQWLADMGATVIKVEEPLHGDYMRTMPPPGLYEQINRGKKSVALDLKTPGGLQSFLSLSDTADVLLEGFRPGVMDRLGCGYRTLHPRNPRLIYAALTGYGAHSPYSGLAGHDVNYLAIAGVLHLIGPPDGPPTIPGVQIADLAGGSMQAVIGILSALLERHRTGEGQFVDISMTHGSAALLPVPLAQLASGDPPPRRGNERLSGRYACYHVYPTGNGRYLAVGALEPKFWATLCQALEVPHLIPHHFAEDPIRSQVITEIETIFRRQSAEQWFQQLRHLDVCVTPVRTVEEAAADLNLTNPDPRPAPTLGEHTRQILRP